jgi:ribonuclease P protein component
MRSPRSLSGKARFARVFAEGRRASSDGVTVWALARADAPDTYLGLSVSARSGGAVLRNRTRRRLRAAVRDRSCKPGDLVVRADGAAMRLSFQKLDSHLTEALHDAGMLEP